MSLELELFDFVKLVPEFTAPVRTQLNLTVSSPKVLSRFAYHQLGQDVPTPACYWTGPFNIDLGQTADRCSGTKKADFWFWFNHDSMTEAMRWAGSVEQAVLEWCRTHPYTNLTTLRITSAIHIDKHPVMKDQTQKTAMENPVSQAVLGFTFAYQNSNN